MTGNYLKFSDNVLFNPFKVYKQKESFELSLCNAVKPDATHISSPTGFPMCQEYSPKMFIGQDLYPDQADETLPDDDDDDEQEDEDDRLSMVALEKELQKCLAED